jgi:hypothetical protein
LSYIKNCKSDQLQTFWKDSFSETNCFRFCQKLFENRNENENENGNGNENEKENGNRNKIEGQ